MTSPPKLHTAPVVHAPPLRLIHTFCSVRLLVIRSGCGGSTPNPAPHGRSSLALRGHLILFACPGCTSSGPSTALSLDVPMLSCFPLAEHSEVSVSFFLFTLFTRPAHSQAAALRTWRCSSLRVSSPLALGECPRASGSPLPVHTPTSYPVHSSADTLLLARFVCPVSGDNAVRTALCSSRLAVHLPHGTDDTFLHPAHFASAASCFVCSAFCPAHVPCSVTTVLVVRGLLLLAPFT